MRAAARDAVQHLGGGHRLGERRLAAFRRESCGGRLSGPRRGGQRAAGGGVRPNILKAIRGGKAPKAHKSHKSSKTDKKEKKDKKKKKDKRSKSSKEDKKPKSSATQES